MAIAVDLIIGNTMASSGRLRDEIFGRAESCAVAGAPINPKQIIMEICSDTPPEDLAGMMLEVAPSLLYLFAHSIISSETSFRSDGIPRGGAKLSDGSKVDLERLDYSVVVPGVGDVVMRDLTADHCARLAEHHKDLSSRHSSLSNFWAAAGKEITAKKATVLGDVMDTVALEALWGKYARSGARSAA